MGDGWFATGCDEDDAIVICGPSQRSQCGELSVSQDTMMHNNEIVMRVPALIVRFTPQSYLQGQVDFQVMFGL